MPDDRIDIRFDEVSRVFADSRRGRVRALAGVSLSCRQGELTCVLGPSGCGKTTLLRMAAGLDTPTSGRVLLQGQEVTGPTAATALVSQEGDLLPWRTVLANAALGLEIRGIRRTRRRRRAMRALHKVGLSAAIARSRPYTLSGGMRRRVALARALAAEARILLMDEPFAGLDEPTRHRLQRELSDLWQADQRTVLFVTHSLEEAVFLADRVVVMTWGRTIAEFPLDLKRPRDRLDPHFFQAIQPIRQALVAHETDDRPA